MLASCGAKRDNRAVRGTTRGVSNGAQQKPPATAAWNGLLDSIQTEASN
jgi:hypothetical protein